MTTTASTPTGTSVRVPFTGEEYLESLRDGREVYIYGRRVDDVTTHPAFRNTAQSIAQMYDALHADAAPGGPGVITGPTDTGNGGFTHKFFTVPHSADDLVAGRDAIAAWQRLSYGWMGRSPDYKASFLGCLGGNTEFFDPYQENARRWYRDSQERVLFLNHALANPPVDRHLGPDALRDVFVHVEEENDNGLVVSGAKCVATGSALTHYNFIGHYGMPLNKKEFAVIFMLPMDAPGVKLVSRASYEYQATVAGSPFDYPLSSRFDENDGIMILDRVQIPWENVFAYGDADKVNGFTPRSGWLPRLTFHGLTRLCVKLDFIAGCVLKAVEIAGTNQYRGVQAHVGEILAWRNVFWGLTEAMARNPIPWVGDAVLPNNDQGAAYRVLAPVAYPRIKDIIENHVASGLIYVNSHAEDWKSDQVRPLLDRFLRGSNGVEALDRVKLMKLLWDAMGTEFGGRHELYERNYAGNQDDTRIHLLRGAEAQGTTDELMSFVDTCLGEYDLDGWTGDHLFNPGPLSTITPH
ncbi:4-hydroxyphenylacetate 3-hydroxylase N-terminal domain-containing protein [Pseudonocardia alni]|uniref:4-hydroxyphenylacetate 3-hydroxylase N-terminal domain-containing protein n=1 Tax=Pseudonocardia alni TaxID=33907 RepID=UPI0033CDA29E